jgi:hypothetical protein
VADRLSGVLLFLPVPLVLFLFTRAPIGLGASLAVGIVVMLTHRLYARPFALAHAASRCLWCGGAAAASGPVLEVKEPLGTTSWRACSDDHAGRFGRLIAWARRRSTGLRVGILGSLGVFLPGALLAGRGWLGGLTFADAVAFFRFGIAATVLPLGWMGPRSANAAAGDACEAPFPVHIQALVGTRSVIWLFRIIGAIWLVQAGLHLAERQW